MKPVRRAAQQVAEAAQAPAQQARKEEADWRETVSTGSLLLDLAISGNKARYGGLPGGFIIEVSGPHSSGKTTILGELWGNAQRAGGECRFEDPEHRLDASYCAMFGVHITQDQIRRPETIDDIFEALIGPVESKSVGSRTVNKRNVEKAWRPDPSRINFQGEDSLAALASRMELEQGDRMGMRRAKDFSEGFRVAKGHISRHNILLVCSNQLRTDTDTGRDKPPGGNAIGFYSSVRISLRVTGQLTREATLGAKRREKRAYGIEVAAMVYKNSLDAPYRTAPIRIIFGYGLDDIGANLQWLKEHGAFDRPDEKTGEMRQAASYEVGGKRYIGLDQAIKAVEDGGLEGEVRDRVVDLWRDIERQVRPERKEKVR